MSSAEQRGQRGDRPRSSDAARSTAAHRLQARLARFSCRIFGQSTRGPMPPRIAGIRVSVVSTLASGISAPPKPMLRMNGTGSTISASRPMATVTPLNTHRVPGGLHRDDDGLVVVAAVVALLAPAGDEQQRVVDGDAEADQGDEELDDEPDVGERR